MPTSPRRKCTESTTHFGKFVTFYIGPMWASAPTTTFYDSLGPATWPVLLSPGKSFGFAVSGAASAVWAAAAGFAVFPGLSDGSHSQCQNRHHRPDEYIIYDSHTIPSFPHRIPRAAGFVKRGRTPSGRGAFSSPKPDEKTRISKKTS